MEKHWLRGVVGLGVLLIVSAGISPAVGEINKLGGDERPVMEAMETASFGWGGDERPVMEAMETASFGWGGDERPVMEAMETASFGAEDWKEDYADYKYIIIATHLKPVRLRHRFLRKLR